MSLSAHVTQVVLFSALISGCATNSSDEASKPMVPQEVALTEVRGAYQIDMTVIEPPQLDGTWRSEAPEPAGNGRYAVREFNIVGSRWEMTYSLASDRAMKNVLFTHKANGTLTLQSPSKRIPGAYLVVYGFNHKTLNVMTSDRTTLKELGFEGCSINPKQEVDISSRGCGIITRLNECPNDYDLLRQESRKSGMFLSIGNKFSEFSACSEDKRPVALGISLIKVR